MKVSVLPDKIVHNYTHCSQRQNHADFHSHNRVKLLQPQNVTYTKYKHLNFKQTVQKSLNKSAFRIVIQR